jgi:hypothetical protein
VDVLVPLTLYSSEIQQPMRATAIMDGHQHTHQAAPFGREQGRAASLQPDGLAIAVHSTCTSGRPAAVYNGLEGAWGGSDQGNRKMMLPLAEGRFA